MTEKEKFIKKDLTERPRVVLPLFASVFHNSSSRFNLIYLV